MSGLAGTSDLWCTFFSLPRRRRRLTSVDGGEGQRGQTLALHLLEPALGLQDRVLELGPPVDVAASRQTAKPHESRRVATPPQLQILSSCIFISHSAARFSPYHLISTRDPRPHYTAALKLETSPDKGDSSGAAGPDGKSTAVKEAQTYST